MMDIYDSLYIAFGICFANFLMWAYSRVSTFIKNVHFMYNHPYQYNNYRMPPSTIQNLTDNILLKEIMTEVQKINQNLKTNNFRATPSWIQTFVPMAQHIIHHFGISANSIDIAAIGKWAGDMLKEIGISQPETTHLKPEKCPAEFQEKKKNCCRSPPKNCPVKQEQEMPGLEDFEITYVDENKSGEQKEDAIIPQEIIDMVKKYAKQIQVNAGNVNE